MNQVRPFLLGSQVLLAIPLTLLACADRIYLFSAVGTWALLIVTAPMLNSDDYDWFSPWTFVAISVFFGCFLRGLCISLGWPDWYQIDHMFLRGYPPDYFLDPCILLILGLVSLTVGFWMGSKTAFQRIPTLVGRVWRPERLTFVCATLFLISVFSSYQYVTHTDGFSWDRLSSKRNVIFDIELVGDDQYNQYGHYREAAELGTVAYFIVLGYALFRPGPKSPALLGCAFVLFLAGAFMPFYTSNRLPILWTLCGTVALLWYSGTTFKVRHGAFLASFAVAIFIGMTILRAQSQGQGEDETVIGKAAQALVVNRNLMGVAKTCHIIRSVPEVLDFEYGGTIARWLLAPIPRSMWPGKPLIHCGPIIGNAVFGTRVSGVPPGLVGELYWNFHLPGVIAGSWLIGLLMRICYGVFRPGRGRNLALTLIYVVGPMRLGFETVSTSIGCGLVLTACEAALMCFAVLCVSDAVCDRVSGAPNNMQHFLKHQRQPSHA